MSKKILSIHWVLMFLHNRKTSSTPLFLRSASDLSVIVFLFEQATSGFRMGSSSQDSPQSVVLLKYIANSYTQAQCEQMVGVNKDRGIIVLESNALLLDSAENVCH